MTYRLILTSFAQKCSTWNIRMDVSLKCSTWNIIELCVLGELTKVEICSTWNILQNLIPASCVAELNILFFPLGFALSLKFDRDGF